MRLLVFEYITCGGLEQEALTDSLAKEAMMMLKSIVDELAHVAQIQVTVVIDQRFNYIELFDGFEIVWVSEKQSFDVLLAKLIEQSDWVWPIAPEMNSVLLDISILVEKKSKKLLNSTAKAVAVCSDKLLTSDCLKKNLIKTVDTVQLDQFSAQVEGQWVIKPKDGVGCLNSYFVCNQNEYLYLKNQISDQQNYIIQPYLKGEALSLSCLFRDGRGWLLCCNQQQVSINKGLFELHACQVNSVVQDEQKYQKLIDQIALAISGLWGYVGIDLIVPETGSPRVLEINPRITTSFVGIHQATGVNVAELVIALLDSEPDIRKTKNNIISVAI